MASVIATVEGARGSRHRQRIEAGSWNLFVDSGLAIDDDSQQPAVRVGRLTEPMEGRAGRIAGEFFSRERRTAGTTAIFEGLPSQDATAAVVAEGDERRGKISGFPEL